MGLLKYLLTALAALTLTLVSSMSNASEFNKAWKNKGRALVLDGYEFNEIDLTTIAKNKRIAAFIHKGSDGLPPQYRCSGDETEMRLCKQTWRRYAVGRELYHTRRALAKALGLKWGAYHLARPGGDPLDQARHFLDYVAPEDDEAIVIDIEDNDPEKWMSLEDAERFAQYIHNRLGRWPMLYTNGSTAQYIADNRGKFETLSRLPLWYARYKPNISTHFPKGHWKSYDIWQFQAQVNCNKKRCPYRIDGANNDIDVNVMDMSVAELRAAWPLDELLPEKVEEPVPNERELLLANAPTPQLRADAQALTATSKPVLANIMNAYADMNRYHRAKKPEVQIASAYAEFASMLHGYRDHIVARETATKKMVETVFVVIEDTMIKPSMMSLATAHLVAAHSRGHDYTPLPVDRMTTSAL